MRQITDMCGRTFHQPETWVPQRIVSLVPSQTELLADLGLDQEVVGITRFCEHPSSWKKQKALVGGTKTVRRERILGLKPDLVLANQEENTREDVEWLEQHLPVWVSRVATLDEAGSMILSVGELCGRLPAARSLWESIQRGFASNLKTHLMLRSLYLIWNDPWMSVGSDTMIHDLMTRAGFANVCSDRVRYPVLSDQEIRELAPQCILLSSEPFPFREKHAAALRKLVPEAEIVFVDGTYFSWYGSRLAASAPYLDQLRSSLARHYPGRNSEPLAP